MIFEIFVLDATKETIFDENNLEIPSSRSSRSSKDSPCSEITLSVAMEFHQSENGLEKGIEAITTYARMRQ